MVTDEDQAEMTMKTAVSRERLTLRANMKHEGAIRQYGWSILLLPSQGPLPLAVGPGVR
jgi:hypothetical protein